MKTCTWGHCQNEHKARGLCSMHYQRRRRGAPMDGDPLVRYPTAEESWAARTEWQGGCLVWTGGLAASGYGVMTVDGKATTAHRYAVERETGKPIPDGAVVDHKYNCPRHCVTAEHLQVVSQRLNTENRAGANLNNRSSGVRNVSWDSKNKKWRVKVGVGGRTVHVGRFTDLGEAERAALRARKDLLTNTDHERLPRGDAEPLPGA